MKNPKAHYIPLKYFSYIYGGVKTYSENKTLILNITCSDYARAQGT